MADGRSAIGLSHEHQKTDSSTDERRSLARGGDPSGLDSGSAETHAVTPVGRPGQGLQIRHGHDVSNLHIGLLSCRVNEDDLATVLVQDEHLRRPHQPASLLVRPLPTVLIQPLDRLLRRRNLLAGGVHDQLHCVLLRKSGSYLDSLRSQSNETTWTEVFVSWRWLTRLTFTALTNAFTCLMGHT